MSKIKKINLGGKDYDLHDATAQRKLNPTSGIILNNDTNEISSYTIHEASDILKYSDFPVDIGVPTTGVTEKIYFNTHLSKDAVVDLCKQLSFIPDPTGTTSNLISCCFMNSDFSYFIAISKSNSYYYIGYSINGNYVDVFDSSYGWLISSDFFLSPPSPNSLQAVADTIGYIPENTLMRSIISTVNFSDLYIAAFSHPDRQNIYREFITHRAPVPNQGLIESVSFNTSLSVTEVNSLLDQLDIPFEGGIGVLFANKSDLTKLSSDSKSIVVFKKPETEPFTDTELGMPRYTIIYSHINSDSRLDRIIFNSCLGLKDEFGYGWNLDWENNYFDGTINLSAEAVNGTLYKFDSSDQAEIPQNLAVGANNNLISDLFFLTDADPVIKSSLFYLDTGKKITLLTDEDEIKPAQTFKAGTGISISEDGTISVSFETAEGNLF